MIDVPVFPSPLRKDQLVKAEANFLKIDCFVEFNMLNLQKKTHH